MLIRLTLALALATLLCASAPAIAADCVQGSGAANRNQCYPPFVPINPATGAPILGGGGSGGGATGDVTAAGTSGTQAQAVQGANGGVPLATRQADGDNVALGAKADAASCASGQSALACFRQLHADLLAPTPAGTAIIGKVGIDQTTPGASNGVQVNNQSAQTTSGALEPATAASGKITVTSTAITASTSTTIAAANANRISYAIQCGSGGVNVSETGTTLASATFGATGATLFIPAGSQPYFTPPVATRTAITAYTATAQTCVVTEYNR